MIVAVTPNPAWDVTYRVAELVPGTSHRVPDVTGRAGGKGVNVARVVRDLGGDALVVAPVGGLHGQAFTASLADDGVAARLVATGVELRQSVAVVPEQASGWDGGHPTLFNESGEPLPDGVWDGLVATVAEAVGELGPEVVTISGSLPPGTTENQLAELIGAGRRGGAAVLVDTSGDALVWAARARADLVKPNRTEALGATGTGNVHDAAAALRELGAGAVVITDGGDGMRYDDGATRLTARLDTELAGNPTGAGDAALAALALGWTLPWPERLRRAVATSAASVTEPVAGRVDADLAASLLARTDLKEETLA
ncbi:tagatose 6-phosphate kinase/hypothetical protein [Georgenia soli]|uniref:Carbohydrate kinase PfkB domain-containing protein n=1 Tax=Georgenia soli TaxID=638953 RepID=A0A2A9EKP9_9MICO|nr:PfkB family carbohydrate kinase [Georgenia soli]PFG39478.1 tagatose 6-phosphate kinase/hypothetical protein [Georgenia soli]